MEPQHTRRHSKSPSGSDEHALAACMYRATVRSTLCSLGSRSTLVRRHHGSAALMGRRTPPSGGCAAGDRGYHGRGCPRAPMGPAMESWGVERRMGRGSSHSRRCGRAFPHCTSENARAPCRPASASSPIALAAGQRSGDPSAEFAGRPKATHGAPGGRVRHLADRRNSRSGRPRWGSGRSRGRVRGLEGCPCRGAPEVRPRIGAGELGGPAILDSACAGADKCSDIFGWSELPRPIVRICPSWFRANRVVSVAAMSLSPSQAHRLDLQCTAHGVLPRQEPQQEVPNLMHCRRCQLLNGTVSASTSPIPPRH